jgi:hypothetical protein
MNQLKDKSIQIIRAWWFSILLIVPSVLVIHQFYLALARNILQAINYDFPLFLGFFFFVLKTVTLFTHEAGHIIPYSASLDGSF